MGGGVLGETGLVTVDNLFENPARCVARIFCGGEGAYQKPGPNNERFE